MMVADVGDMSSTQKTRLHFSCPSSRWPRILARDEQTSRSRCCCDSLSRSASAKYDRTLLASNACIFISSWPPTAVLGRRHDALESMYFVRQDPCMRVFERHG